MSQGCLHLIESIESGSIRPPAIAISVRIALKPALPTNGGGRVVLCIDRDNEKDQLYQKGL